MTIQHPEVTDNLGQRHRGLTLNQKLAKLFAEHLKYGGLTLSPEGEVITDGIAVALNKYSEHKVPYKSYDYVLLYIEQWLETRTGKNCLGFWVDADDDDTVYLDEVKIFKDTELKKAVYWALDNNQIAVQLLHPNVTLRIDR